LAVVRAHGQAFRCALVQQRVRADVDALVLQLVDDRAAARFEALVIVTPKLLSSIFGEHAVTTVSMSPSTTFRSSSSSRTRWMAALPRSVAPANVFMVVLP
jgi:hypothetical protein